MFLGYDVVILGCFRREVGPRVVPYPLIQEAANPNLDSTLNAALRFGESCIGTALAIFFSYLRGLKKENSG